MEKLCSDPRPPWRDEVFYFAVHVSPRLIRGVDQTGCLIWVSGCARNRALEQKNVAPFAVVQVLAGEGVKALPTLVIVIEERDRVEDLAAVWCCIRLDQTVLEIADLQPGWQAVRDNVGGPWRRREHPSVAEDEL